MKYNDKHTKLLQTKHQDKLDSIGTIWATSRSDRREFKREFNKFKTRVILHTNVDLWDCINETDQVGIFNSWRFSHTKLRPNGSLKPDFKSWIKNEIKSIEIDKHLYRDKVIDRLLDEVQ